MELDCLFVVSCRKDIRKEDACRVLIFDEFSLDSRFQAASTFKIVVGLPRGVKNMSEVGSSSAAMDPYKS